MQSVLLVLFIFFVSFSENAFAKGAYKFDHKKLRISASPTGVANELLMAQRWDASYNAAREREIRYLISGIDGPALDGLSKEQRKQVLEIIQNIIIKQMLDDREYFRRELITQYAQFFTSDELYTLIKYFNTSLIQMVVDRRISGVGLTRKDVKDQLLETKSVELKQVEDVGGTYLFTRYVRFQEKSKQIIDRMIVDRLKEVMGYVLNHIPDIVDHVSKNRPLKQMTMQKPGAINEVQ